MVNENAAKDALWELHSAKRSLDASQAKLESLAKTFSDLSTALTDFLQEPVRRRFPGGSTLVFDRQKLSDVPSGTAVLQAIDEFKREHDRLVHALREAKCHNLLQGSTD